MDEFLSEVYVEYFKKWILLQTSKDYKLYFNDNDSNIMLIEAENSLSRVTFNRFNIIELCVMNNNDNKLEFYIHFQMQNLGHAKRLFEEMIECIYNTIKQPVLKILLSCSSGLTTSYFAEKLSQTAELLELNYQFQAVGWEKVLAAALDFDVLLLAPQISYQCARIQKILPNKLVLKIPTLIFASYDCLKLFEFIKESLLLDKVNNNKTIIKLSP